MTRGWKSLDTTLHFTVVDATPWAPAEMSDALGGRVGRASEVRHAWRAGLGSHSTTAPRSPKDSAALFDVYGPFDFAALYLSPELAPPPIGDGVGGHVHVALLLEPPAGTVPPLDADYVAHWRANDQGRFDDAPFLAFVKCKLNPSVIYDRDPSTQDPTGSVARHENAVRVVWDVVATWRAAAQGAARPRYAAVGLSVGWNDLVVVAHAACPDELLALVEQIRRTTMPAEAYGEDDKVSHVCATSVTTVGCLSRVRVAAEERARADSLPLDADGDVSADALLEVATRGSAVAYATGCGGSGQRAFLRPAFHAYPGHEAVIHRRLRKAWESLRAWRGDPVGAPGSTSTFEAGKHDVVGFPVRFGWFADPQSAVAYMSLLHRWTCTGTLSATPSPDTTTPAHFDVHTYFGGDPADEPGPTIPSNHVRGGLPTAYGIPSLALDAKFRATVLDEIVRDTRTLQLPFALSEQVRNMANRFVWAWNEVVARDEVVDLAPLVFGLRDRLREAVGRVERVAIGAEDPSRDRVTDRVWAAEAQSEVELRMSAGEAELQSVQEDCEQIVRAFRINLGNRHHAGYRSEDIVDLNVPFRGALHQLLATVGMATDALLRMLVPDAPLCASVFGPTTVTTMRCGPALLVRLSPWMLTFPLQLEVVGHEVAHAFLQALIRARRTSEIRDEPPTWKACADALRRLDVDLFDGTLAGSEFAEPLSDWLEAILLGHLADDPPTDARSRHDALRSWTRSAFARHVLQDAAALTVDVAGGSAGARAGATRIVPRGDAFVRATARAVNVWLVEELLSTPEAEVRAFASDRTPKARQPVAMEALFQCLRTECLTGSGALRDDVLGDVDRWREYVRTEVIRRSDVPWTTDAAYAGVVRSTTGALRAHIAHARRDAANRWTGHVAREVAEALSDVRATVLTSLVPSTLYASSLAEGEIRGMHGAAIPDAVRRDEQPFVAPSGGRRVPAALVNVRGGVIAGTPAIEAAWCRAHADFYRRLIPYVPAWRQQIVYQLRLRTDAPAKGSGP